MHRCFVKYECDTWAETKLMARDIVLAVVGWRWCVLMQKFEIASCKKLATLDHCICVKKSHAMGAAVVAADVVGVMAAGDFVAAVLD